MPRKRTPSPRRRGAQPGNLNALRHGFYSHTFSTRLGAAAADRPVFGDGESIDLTPEIELLRSYGQELLTAKPDTMADALQLARAITHLTSAINRLTRTQHLLSNLSAIRAQPQSQPPPGAQPAGAQHRGEVGGGSQ